MSTKPGDPGTDQFPEYVIMGIPPGLLKHAPPTRKKSRRIPPPLGENLRNFGNSWRSG